MDTDLKFEFKVDLKPVRHASYRCRMAKISNEPRLRQYLVLAYQIRDVLDPSTRPPLSALLRVNPERSREIEKDAALTSKQIAEWLNMTPPRICQIMDLLLLCPKVQQEILLSENKRLYSMGEYNVRGIVKEPLWEKQIEMWGSLLKS